MATHMDVMVLIYTMLVSTSAIMAVTLALAWWMFDRPRHALTWACAFGCGVLQWSISGVGSARYGGAPFFGVVAGSLVALMMTLVTIGARQRAGRPDRTAWFAAAWIGQTAALAAAGFALRDAGMRLMLTNLYPPLILPLAILATRPRQRGANPSEIFMMAALALLAAFALMLAIIALRLDGAMAEYRLALVIALPPINIALGIALCFVLAGDLAERLHALVTRDPLTGALNRRGLEQAAMLAIAGARRHRRQLTLVVADLDRFKAINDARGHAAGDRALCRFADAAHALIRGGDLFARLGGDEFCLLLEAGPEAAMRAVERVRAAVGADPTASFGLATLRGPETLDDLIARADEALYRAKAGGRDRAMLAAA